MSGYSQIKGISVKIDGDTTGFQKAINEIKRETSGLDKTMSKLKASMKLNPNDFSSFATYQNLLKDKIQSTSKQLDVYNKKLKEYPKTQQQWTDQVNKSKATLSQYQTKLNSTESAMSALQKEYKTNQTQIQAWKDAIGDSYHTTAQCETAISTLAARNKELSVSMKANSASQKEYNAKIAEQKKNLVDLGSTYEESQRTFNGLRAGAATLNNELKILHKIHRVHIKILHIMQNLQDKWVFLQMLLLDLLKLLQNWVILQILLVKKQHKVLPSSQT